MILLADSEGPDRLHRYAVWSGPLLSAYAWRQVFALRGPVIVPQFSKEVTASALYQRLQDMNMFKFWDDYKIQIREMKTILDGR